MNTKSTCVKCGNQTFEMVRDTPCGSNFYYMFIRCNNCGGVVGVVEGFNVGQTLQLQNEALRQIAARVGAEVSLPKD